ncbi:HNH endonuclease signature motif containing protein [Motilibacter aurantiacus]|uniref:HNH endonuclease signature motif containing protein n=1 Tax=Motilibacter aurantiacus TaxID=2714955 RepID=UPI0038B3F5EF
MARFWAKVLIPDLPLDACWEWQAGRNRGYGRFSLNDKSVLAHRVAYILAHGSIPDGLVVDHLCRNRRCVRPDHLDACTQGENVRRGRAGENQRSKTHCTRGHAYSGSNLVIRVRRNGSRTRDCRECMMERNRRAGAAYRARRRAERRAS